MNLSGQSNTDVRIVLVDPYDLPRQALRDALESDSTLSVVGEADSTQYALQLARRLQPDILLMETAMPVIGGFEATRLLKQELPNVHVILMSAIYSRAEIEAEATRHGASLFWEKMSNVFTDLIPAIAQMCRPLTQAPSRGV